MKKKNQKDHEIEWLYHDDSHLARPKPKTTPEQDAMAKEIAREFWRTFDIRDYALKTEE